MIIHIFTMCSKSTSCCFSKQRGSWCHLAPLAWTLWQVYNESVFDLLARHVKDRWLRGYNLIGEITLWCGISYDGFQKGNLGKPTINQINLPKDRVRELRRWKHHSHGSPIGRQLVEDCLFLLGYVGFRLGLSWVDLGCAVHIVGLKIGVWKGFFIASDYEHLFFLGCVGFKFGL